MAADNVRVLQCYAGNLYGGIERQMVMSARERRDENPLGRSFALCFPGRLSRELAQTQAEVHWMGEVRLSRPWTVLAARKRLRKLLERGGHDVVICHAMWPLLVFGPVVKQMGLPLCAWAHDTAEQVHWIERRAVRSKPDLVIANSEFTRQHWVKFHPHIRSQVHYYAIQDPKHDDAAQVRGRVRQELCTAADECVLLIAARFEEWKGHRVLLQALAQMKHQSGWKCWIAGGAQREHEKQMVHSLQQQAQQLQIADRISWLGERSDVFDLMLAADIYCQPNTAGEPFGVVFVEAMLARLAVVTSDIGAPVEFIDADCGVPVPAKDEARLADALQALVTNPERRAKLGEHARQRALEMFGFQSNLAKLRQSLCELLPPPRTRGGDA